MTGRNLLADRFGRPGQVRQNSQQTVLVSVIIPAFNVETWIEQCLNSVLCQSYRNLEIIVINDGSTDGTESVIEKFARTDHRIISIKQENCGLSATRNRGISLSNGALLMFIDSDDWIHPETVLRMVALYEKHKPDVIFYRCAKYFETKQRWSSGSDDYYWTSLCRSPLRICRSFEAPQLLAVYPLAPLKVIQRDFMTKHAIQFLENLQYEDNPYHVEIFGLNPKIALLDKKLYAWRHGRTDQITSRAHPQDCLTAIRKMLRYHSGANNDFLPYLIIAITRLICTVAQNICGVDNRTSFITTAVSKVRKSVEPSEIETAISRLRAPAVAHPGDLILVNALFRAPNSLAVALDAGFRRYWGSIRLVLLTCQNANIGSRVTTAVFLIRHFKMLLNYSKGIGERKADSLG